MLVDYTASPSTASWGATWICIWQKLTRSGTTARHTTRARSFFISWPQTSLVQCGRMWTLWAIPSVSWTWRYPRWLQLDPHFTQSFTSEGNSDAFLHLVSESQNHQPARRSSGEVMRGDRWGGARPALSLVQSQQFIIKLFCSHRKSHWSDILGMKLSWLRLSHIV